MEDGQVLWCHDRMSNWALESSQGRRWPGLGLHCNRDRFRSCTFHLPPFGPFCLPRTINAHEPLLIPGSVPNNALTQHTTYNVQRRYYCLGWSSLQRRCGAHIWSSDERRCYPLFIYCSCSSSSSSLSPVMSLYVGSSQTSLSSVVPPSQLNDAPEEVIF